MKNKQAIIAYALIAVITVVSVVQGVTLHTLTTKAEEQQEQIDENEGALNKMLDETSDQLDLIELNAENIDLLYDSIIEICEVFQ